MYKSLINGPDYIDDIITLANVIIPPEHYDSTANSMISSYLNKNRVKINPDVIEYIRVDFDYYNK